MTAELEVQLRLYSRAPTRRQRTNVLSLATNGGHSVQCPRNPFEDRRFSRSVLANDPRKPWLEFDQGIRMQAKVLEAKTAETHASALRLERCGRHSGKSISL